MKIIHCLIIDLNETQFEKLKKVFPSIGIRPAPGSRIIGNENNYIRIQKDSMVGWERMSAYHEGWIEKAEEYYTYKEFLSKFFNKQIEFDF